MSTTDDAMARARDALRQVDAELDLSRVRTEALTRARSRASQRPDPDDDPVVGIEILRHGQRPSLPRRRAAVWALAATVVLLGGAGLGTAMLWQGPGEHGPDETVPGAPAPGTGRPTQEPGTLPTVLPRECSGPPTADEPTPSAGTADDTDDDTAADNDTVRQAPQDCALEPTPEPSER